MHFVNAKSLFSSLKIEGEEEEEREDKKEKKAIQK